MTAIQLISRIGFFALVLSVLPFDAAEAGRGCTGPKCDDTQMGFLMVASGLFGVALLKSASVRQAVRTYVPYGYMSVVPAIAVLILGGVYWMYFGRDHFEALIGVVE